MLISQTVTNTEISVAVIENCNRFSCAKSANIFQQKQKKNHFRQFSFSVPKSDLLMKSLTLQCYEWLSLVSRVLSSSFYKLHKQNFPSKNLAKTYSVIAKYVARSFLRMIALGWSSSPSPSRSSRSSCSSSLSSSMYLSCRFSHRLCMIAHAVTTVLAKSTDTSSLFWRLRHLPFKRPNVL